MPIRNAKKATLLISRQAMRPNGSDAWVRNTVAAIDWIKKRGYSICSSTGMLTWDLITTIAAAKKVPLHLIIANNYKGKTTELREWIVSEYRMVQAPVTIEIVEEASKTTAAQKRDELLIRTADILLPISIRLEGSLEARIKASEKETDRSFETPYQTRTEPIGYSLQPDYISDELRQMESDKPDYLIHWTRANNGKWPDEKISDFINDIIISKSYPRSAFHTLERILSQRRLVASARHMPRKAACVSFSQLPPTEVLPLMRWRARYREMSFEPYGIGIARELAEQLGIRAVQYVDDNRKAGQASDERWLTQSRGKHTDWQNEKEYRTRGDIDLSQVPNNKLVAFCRFRSEAAQLQAQTGIRTIPMDNRTD